MLATLCKVLTETFSFHQKASFEPNKYEQLLGDSQILEIQVHLVEYIVGDQSTTIGKFALIIALQNLGYSGNTTPLMVKSLHSHIQLLTQQQIVIEWNQPQLESCTLVVIENISLAAAKDPEKLRFSQAEKESTGPASIISQSFRISGDFAWCICCNLRPGGHVESSFEADWSFESIFLSPISSEPPSMDTLDSGISCNYSRGEGTSWHDSAFRQARRRLWMLVCGKVDIWNNQRPQIIHQRKPGQGYWSLWLSLPEYPHNAVVAVSEARIQGILQFELQSNCRQKCWSKGSIRAKFWRQETSYFLFALVLQSKGTLYSGISKNSAGGTRCIRSFGIILKLVCVKISFSLSESWVNLSGLYGQGFRLYSSRIVGNWNEAKWKFMLFNFFFLEKCDIFCKELSLSSWNSIQPIGNYYAFQAILSHEVIISIEIQLKLKWVAMGS